MKHFAMYRYQFVVGTAEFYVYGIDDRKARRLLSRWIRLVWAKYKAEKSRRYPGSMADATDNAWHSLPEAKIFRASVCTAGITQCEPWPLIERFEVCDKTIAEFTRAYDSKRYDHQ
jgi:hypothetical protein